MLVRREDDELLVTLNRPERRNAYGAEVRHGLVEALRLALVDTTITKIVLDGSGPSFSAGVTSTNSARHPTWPPPI